MEVRIAIEVNQVYLAGYRKSLQAFATNIFVQPGKRFRSYL